MKDLYSIKVKIKDEYEYDDAALMRRVAGTLEAWAADIREKGLGELDFGMGGSKFGVRMTSDTDMELVIDAVAENKAYVDELEAKLGETASEVLVLRGEKDVLVTQLAVQEQGVASIVTKLWSKFLRWLEKKDEPTGG
jgi:hypothetical protein